MITEARDTLMGWLLAAFDSLCDTFLDYRTLRNISVLLKLHEQNIR